MMSTTPTTLSTKALHLAHDAFTEAVDRGVKEMQALRIAIEVAREVGIGPEPGNSAHRNDSVDLINFIAYEAEGSREKHAEDTLQNILLLIGEYRGHLEFQEDYDRAATLRKQLIEDFEG